MNAQVLTFFNNKGGVGKTSLIYHVAWMLADLEYSILAVDLDPQANLTAAFLAEDTLETLWNESDSSDATTMFKCVAPLMKVGDLMSPTVHDVTRILHRRTSSRTRAGHISPTVHDVTRTLHLIPGDLSLSRFEDSLSAEWPNCLGSDDPYRSFRVTTAFWQVIKDGVEQCKADLVLVDVGPSLGAINRSALIATDFVVVPLGADLFSRQGLRNLGPTLQRWRKDWKTRRRHYVRPEFDLPTGRMAPVGYLIQQHGVRLSRPVKAYDRWVKQMPAEYARHVMSESDEDVGTPVDDPHRIATIKHYRSLVPLGQDARKPIFSLTSADGAIGSHAVAANDAYTDFKDLAGKLLRRCGVKPLPS